MPVRTKGRDTILRSHYEAINFSRRDERFYIRLCTTVTNDNILSTGRLGFRQ